MKPDRRIYHKISIYVFPQMFSETYMELNESVGPQRKDNIFTWCNSLGLKWISLALIASFPRKTPTQYQHRPIRVEGKFDMKPDRRIYHKISIYVFPQMFSETYMELNESVGPQKKDNIFTWCNSLGLKWISLALIASFPRKTPTQYQHRPIRVKGNFDMKPDRRIYHKISI